MAKVSSVEKNKNRAQLIRRFANRRAQLKSVIMDRDTAPEERFEAVMKLAEMPRNSAGVRYRNRCAVTGRPRAVYRKFKLARVMLRDLASRGQIPGMVKSSW